MKSSSCIFIYLNTYVCVRVSIYAYKAVITLYFLTCPELLTSKFISTQCSLLVSYPANSVNHLHIMGFINITIKNAD